MRIILSIVILCFLNLQSAFATSQYPSPFQNQESGLPIIMYIKMIRKLANFYSGYKTVKF